VNGMLECMTCRHSIGDIEEIVNERIYDRSERSIQTLSIEEYEERKSKEIKQIANKRERNTMTGGRILMRG
jgi:hypothetical protein